MGELEAVPAPVLPPEALASQAPPAVPRSALGRKASLVLGGSVLGSLMGLVTTFFLGRYFDKDAFGLYVVATGALGIVQLLADLGFGPAHIHFVGKGTDASRALGVYARVRLVLTLSVALAVAGGGYVWFALLGKTFTDATTLPIVAVVLGTQAAILVRTVFVDTWVGQERFNRSELTKSVDTFLVMSCIAGLALAVAASQGRWTPAGPLASTLAQALGMQEPWSLAQVGFAIALAYLVAKVLSLVPVLVLWLRDPIRIGPWDPELARRYARFALPVAFGASAAMLVPWTDKVMLGFFGTSGDAAAFEIAMKYAGVGGILATALAVPLLPRFSLLLQGGKSEEASRTLRRVERFLLLLAVPVTTVVFMLPGQVLHIVANDEYVPTAPAMRLLALGALIGTAMVPTVTKVMGGGHSRATMVGTLITVAANASLNLWLIPAWGAGLGVYGAAISALVSTALAAVYIRLVLKAKFGIPAWNPLFLKMAVAAAAPVALLWAAQVLAPPEAFARWWLMALWSGGAFAVFLLAAWALRLFSLADVRTVWRVANPRALGRELRGRRD